MTWQRSLIVLSAVLLVVSFALATAGPIDLSLQEMLMRISPTLPTKLRTGLPVWMADRVVVPLLVRPVWLVPVCLALICGGWALCLPNGDRPVGRSRLR